MLVFELQIENFWPNYVNVVQMCRIKFTFPCYSCRCKIQSISIVAIKILFRWLRNYPLFLEKFYLIKFLIGFIFVCRFFKRFELPLLAQSLVMNLTMFLMIHLCVKVKRNNSILKTRDRVFTGNCHFVTSVTHSSVIVLHSVVVVISI